MQSTKKMFDFNMIILLYLIKQWIGINIIVFWENIIS
jgi:hypothetical protein